MTSRFFSYALFLLSALFLISCGQRRLEKDVLIYHEPAVPAVIEKKKEKIVIDAGHGGKDAGTQSEKNRYEEKLLTLQTARLVGKYLEELGYETFLTRESDQYISLEQRACYANSINAHLFVSIHYNFSESTEAEGVEVYYYKDTKNPSAARLVESKKLGESVLARVVKHTGARSRGIKTANFAVVRETKMPAVLIEGGFLSNPKEREKLKSNQYRCFLAWGIAKGIDSYLRAHPTQKIARRG